MWDTPAELHAILNDAPAALLVFSVVFDLAGEFTRRESLRAAGFWSLIGGTVGAILAILSGLSAEEWIEHGDAVHSLIEQHERFALVTTSLFVMLAIWRLSRRGLLPKLERRLYLVAASTGLLLVAWVGHLGGQILFRYGGGIPPAVMRSALADIERGHTHEPGEDHETALEELDELGEAAGNPGTGGGLVQEDDTAHNQ